MALTKTQFLTYLDSPLHLWAQLHDQLDPTEFSAYDQLIIRQGYEIEKMAKVFLEQKVAKDYPAGSSIEFQYQLSDGQYEAKIDALVHDVVNNTYDLFEIKSSTKVDRRQKYDVTFQHLIASATLPVNTTYLVHINGECIKKGEIVVSNFFEIEEMSQVISSLREEVLEKRSSALNISRMKNPPIELHCYKPNTCPCKQLCHPNIGAYPVYDLSWWKAGQYETLIQKGYRNLSEVAETEDLNLKQILQIQSIKQEKPMIDHEGIQRELGNVVYPLYFLDYETFAPALPVFDGYKPYQHIVFQFSLHTLNNPNSLELKHAEFLLTEKRDPSKEITEQLLKVIGAKGSIFVWNKNFEYKRNEELASLQPMYAEELSAINARIFDLMEIFKHGLYVDYRFHGSASIKKVLPVLVPHLSYQNLTIGEGATAMTAWWEMVHGKTDKDQTAKNLLEYCKLDTLAMVEIWKVLHSLSESQKD